MGGLGDIVGIMEGSKYFSSIDLKAAFHQLPLKKSDRHKTAFRDPTGRLLEECCHLRHHDHPGGLLSVFGR